jgi:hypothetical protein
LQFRLPSALASLALAGVLVATTAGHAFADRRGFTFQNRATDGTVIAKLYVSSSETSDWEEDTLGKDVLNPGESWDISFSKYDGEAGKCLYDIKAVTTVGAEAFLYKVDLCSTTNITYGPQ